MNKIFYWSPFTSSVATIRSVINSAYGVKKYLNNKFEPLIVDAVNEWDSYLEELNKNNISVIKLYKKTNFHKYKKIGFIRSRIAYFYIFLKAFYPLHKLIKQEKPTYLIIHLVTSLPLILFIFQNYQTKLILRISGLPKMTILRKFLWKIAAKKIYKITCPTDDTFRDLSKFDFLCDKLTILKDPIINIEEIKKLKLIGNKIDSKNDLIISRNDFFLSIGRFTKQKNFIFYLKCIPKILELNKNLYFVFIGHGDNEKLFFETAKNLKILHRLIIIKNTDNVHYFMSKAKCLVITSLWEDPGFVLVEAGYNNCQVISSDCPNGPKEIISDDAGYLFKSNNEKDLLEKVSEFLNDTHEIKIKKKIKLKKRVKKFTLFEHTKTLNKLLV